MLTLVWIRIRTVFGIRIRIHKVADKEFNLDSNPQHCLKLIIKIYHLHNGILTFLNTLMYISFMLVSSSLKIHSRVLSSKLGALDKVPVRILVPIHFKIKQYAVVPIVTDSTEELRFRIN